MLQRSLYILYRITVQISISKIGENVWVVFVNVLFQGSAQMEITFELGHNVIVYKYIL
jgi:hypothetical protein